MLAFGEGQTLQTFDITILNDALVEGDETVEVALSNPIGGISLGIQLSILTIADNDRGLEFSASVYEVEESAAMATLIVQRTGDPPGPGTVTLTMNGGDAVPGVDFLPPQPLIEFAEGETMKTVAIPIQDNPQVTGNKAVGWVLSEPTGGIALGAQAATELRVLDNESPSNSRQEVQFVSNLVTVTEDTGHAELTVRRLGQSTGEVRVEVATLDGTALAPRDYTSQSQTVTFGPLETVKTVLIPIVDDAAAERQERLSVRLLNPSADTLLVAPATGEVVIVDNDYPGSLDAGFNPGITALGVTDSAVTALALQPDGKVLVGGNTELHRLNEDGSVDPSFKQVKIGGGVSDILKTVLVLPDGKLLLQGSFSTINGTLRPGLARLHSDGVLDEEFIADIPTHVSPGPWWGCCGTLYSSVHCIALQPDGKILVGGDAELRDVPRNGIARLHPGGLADDSFDPGTGVTYSGSPSLVRSLALQTDGQVLIAGDFDQVNGIDRFWLARLEANGTVDPDFNPQFLPYYITSILEQPDGKILIGGSFNQVNGISRPGVARLNGDRDFFRISGPSGPAGGPVRLRINSQPGRTYVLEISPDLEDWAFADRKTAAGYALEFEGIIEADWRSRFYRARLE